MPPTARVDPYGAFNFQVKIDGVVTAAFLECSGLSTETDVIEYREGTDPLNSVRKLPGLTHYSPIVLTRGVTTSSELWKWRKNIIAGNVDRRNVSIILLGDDHTEVLRWDLTSAWPSKWVGPALNAKGSQVAIEALEIVYEELNWPEGK